MLANIRNSLIHVRPLCCWGRRGRREGALAQDVDGDGGCELLVGLTDRILRSYRYIKDDRSEGHLQALNKWELPGQFYGLAIAAKPGGSSEVVVSQARARFIRIAIHPPSFQCKGTPSSLLSSARRPA